jgi:hypothetical protein
VAVNGGGDDFGPVYSEFTEFFLVVLDGPPRHEE